MRNRQRQRRLFVVAAAARRGSGPEVTVATRVAGICRQFGTRTRTTSAATTTTTTTVVVVFTVVINNGTSFSGSEIGCDAAAPVINQSLRWSFFFAVCRIDRRDCHAARYLFHVVDGLEEFFIHLAIRWRLLPKAHGQFRRSVINLTNNIAAFIVAHCCTHTRTHCITRQACI